MSTTPDTPVLPEDRGVVVRPGRADDAAGLARVHVAAWRAAYRGQMPDAYLDAMDPARWERGWDRMFAEGRTRHLRVATRDGAVVGFVDVGPEREPDGPPGPAPRGELYAINVHPDAWGSGAGRALLEAAQDALRALGFADAVLWVLPGNARARRFYERAGWADEGTEKTTTVNGVEVVERRYARTL
ncbi:GNAT family N-acetyltransferase [Actinotalea solisilvae]|uniref:GNAT family N-acetyltransferase n=1 Tax=Actinotalea solisilvae TaxID=2072922 RepID=UPI0018F226E1|nr:GNAT family N-acetyltransferase [Actinotalea solisilvae]